MSADQSELIIFLKSEFEAHRNPEYAKSMSQYMRNMFEFYGINTPKREEIIKKALLKFPIKNFEELNLIVNFCYQQKEREWQYTALTILKKYKKYCLKEDILHFLKDLLIKKSWWDTVDIISSNIVGFILKNNKELQYEMIDDFYKSGNIWLQRCTIIFQLTYKNDVDNEILKNVILDHSKSKEFFLQKAIGWALRQYIKYNQQWVLEFVNQNELKPLSKREALKNYLKGK